MSFQIEKMNRDTTRKNWRELHRLLRKYGDFEQIDDALADREKLKAKLEECVVDGKIALVSSGMDCDCSQYVHAYVQQYRGVFWFQMRERDSYEWADGPMNFGFCKPEERPDHSSRDLAMEAYEDGRPHLISAAL